MRSNLGEPILQYLRIKRVKKYIPQNASLLDVGCGNGNLLFNLANRLSYGEGLDQKVNSHTEGNIHLQSWHASMPLPFPSASFGAVTMMAVLEHLDNPRFVLSECLRVLEPAGRLLLTTPSPMAKPILEFLSFRLGIVSPQEIADHKHYFSKDEIRQFLLAVGFPVSAISIKYFQFGFNVFALAVK